MSDINSAGQNVVTAINNLATEFTTGSPLLRTFIDRAALRSANLPSGANRIYINYFNSATLSTTDINNSLPVPHVSGHFMRKHTMLASGTSAQMAALTPTQLDQYFLETDVTPNLVWWWMGAWYPVGHIGYAWDVSSNGTYWQVDELEPNVLQMGGVNDTNAFNVSLAIDQSIPFTDLSYYFALERNVFVPSGSYYITQTITLSTPGENTFRGEGGDGGGDGTNIVFGPGINGITIANDIVFGFGEFGGSLKDFSIVPTNYTTCLSGIYSPTSVQLSGSTFERVHSSGSVHGYYIGKGFQFTMRQCFGGSTNNGWGFAIMGAFAGVLLDNCYGTSQGAVSNGILTGVFRLCKGANLVTCNIIDGGPPNFSLNSAWGVLTGGYASVSGTAQTGSSNSITLAAGSTAVTDQIVGMDVVLTSGTGSGQTSRVQSYNSGTQVASISPNWTTNPSSTTGYTVQDPVDFCRTNQRSTLSVHGGNFESYTLNGIRTYNDYLLVTSGCVFQGRTTGHEAAIHLSPNSGASSFTYDNRQVTNTTGRTATADVVSEGAPALWLPNGGTYYDNVAAATYTYGVSQSSSVGGLPPASSVPAGTRSFVTDSNATTFHNTVASGGANKVPVVSDGTNWLIG